MGKLRREVGFWAAVGRLQVADVFTVEAAASVVLGGGFAYLVLVTRAVEDRAGIAATYVAVVAALLAIVFAGLALVASLLSEDYLRLLRAGETGVLGFFRPFMIAIGVQVATVLGSVAYVGLAPEIDRRVEPWVFGAVSVLFVASCLEVVVLTRSVLMHALLRSRFSEVRELEAERERRRGGASSR